jgi:putative ABC transport system permease protein
MPLLAKVRSFLRNLVSARRVEADLDQEVHSHLELLITENIRAGMASKEAERAARMELGGIEQVKEQIREEQLGNWLHSVLADCRYGFRQLRKNPGATAVMVFTLALAIGATTAIFSVVYGVLLRPLPYSDSNRIMAIFEVTSTGRPNRLADPNFDDFRDQNRSFKAIAKYNENVVSVSGTSQPTRTTIASVSPDFLKVFGIQPILGRDFSASDAKKGAGPTVLASYGYWRQYLGSSPDLSQLHLKIDGAVYSVIGVLPAGFRFSDVELWLPADLEGENPSRTSHNYRAVGRLQDGVTVEQANGDISAIARRIHEASSEQGDYLLKDGMVLPLQDSITGKARPALLVLLGAVGFLLLVACANVANLLLAQASARERELAIRGALGAARGRLIRQFLTEAFLLSLVGGGLGVLGALGGVAGLIALAPDNLPRLESVSISIPVLVFAFLLSAAVAAGLGAFTAARATSGDLRKGLGEGGRGQAGSKGGQRVGRILVAAQIAITLVLVIGAGLLGRSLLKVLEVNPGFRVDKIVAMDVSLPWVEDPQAKAGQAIFYANLIDRLKQIPGVRKVGATSVLPMVEGGLPDGMFLLMTQNEVPKTFDGFGPLLQQKERIGNADFCVATDGYFQALGIPLIRGRIFDEHDGANSPHVAVISESLARERWPKQDPIGHTIEFGNMDGDLRLLTIVGIVGDTHEYGLDVPPRPTVYVNLFQRPRAAITLTMLSDADTGSVTSAARGILEDLNPEIPTKFQTFSQVYSASLGSRRFNVILTGFFGITALLLATAGVFGVMAYSVSRRTREIGVRVALGAGSGDVLKMILGQGLRTVLLGVAIGIAGSLALTRTVESLLFGVTATDPLTFGGVTLLLAGAALLACYLPARRATKVDPLVALRYE